MELLHSQIIGKGDPLLILHGFLGMSDNWKTLGKQYAEIGFEVHLIDQRNHGRSFHSDEFNYNVLAQDLKTYAIHHNLYNINLLGHSMGGKTVMQMACTHSKMIKKLLVADIAPKYYPPHHQNIMNGLAVLTLNQLVSRSAVDEALAIHIPEYGIRQFLLKNLYWASKERLDFRFNLKVLSEKIEEIGREISALDNFKGPTLFLKGDRSEYITEADIPLIKQHFPNANTVTIQNAGHWLHAENPKQFFEKSIRFLTS